MDPSPALLKLVERVACISKVKIWATVFNITVGFGCVLQKVIIKKARGSETHAMFRAAVPRCRIASAERKGFLFTLSHCIDYMSPPTNAQSFVIGCY